MKETWWFNYNNYLKIWSPYTPLHGMSSKLSLQHVSQKKFVRNHQIPQEVINTYGVCLNISNKLTFKNCF